MSKRKKRWEDKYIVGDPGFYYVLIPMRKGSRSELHQAGYFHLRGRARAHVRRFFA